MPKPEWCLTPPHLCICAFAQLRICAFAHLASVDGFCAFEHLHAQQTNFPLWTLNFNQLECSNFELLQPTWECWVVCLFVWVLDCLFVCLFVRLVLLQSLHEQVDCGIRFDVHEFSLVAAKAQQQPTERHVDAHTLVCVVLELEHSA